MITIDEAIKYLNLIHEDRRDDGVPDDMPGQKAIQLGVEALGIIEEIRTANGLDAMMKVIWDKVFKPLPSEGEKE